MLANCTGHSNVTSAPEVVMIFVTASAVVPPTVTGASLSKRIVSVEAGAVAAATPSTSQLPGVDQSAPFAPFQT